MDIPTQAKTGLEWATRPITKDTKGARRKSFNCGRKGITKVAKKSFCTEFLELLDLSDYIACSSVEEMSGPKAISTNMGSFDYVRLAPHFAQDDSVS